MLKNINLGIRFLLELCLLAALGYTGFHITTGNPGWILGIGLPLLAACIWGYAVAPKAAHALQQPYRIILELVLFSAGIYGLYYVHQKQSALFFAVAVLMNGILLIAWKQ